MTFGSLFFKKLIFAEIQIKTHISELLAIVEAFKSWRHSLEGGKYKVFILTNYNNFYQFMDIKNLSFRQIK